MAWWLLCHEVYAGRVGYLQYSLHLSSKQWCNCGDEWRYPEIPWDTLRYPSFNGSIIFIRVSFPVFPYRGDVPHQHLDSNDQQIHANSRASIAVHWMSPWFNDVQWQFQWQFHGHHWPQWSARPHETHCDCKACLYNHPGQVRGQPPPGGTIEDAEQQVPRLQRRVLLRSINRY